MNHPKFKLVLAALVFAIVNFACGGSTPSATELPVQATAGAPQPTATLSEPEGQLEIVNTTSYLDNYNDYNVVGEIKNSTNRTLENITLELSITDSDGNQIESVEIQPFIYTLSPKTSSPFGYYISVDDQQPADFKVSIKSYDQTSTDNLAEMSLENVKTAEAKNGDIVITGEFVNLSDDQVEIESMAGAMLDKDLQIISANFTQTYQHYLYPAGDAAGRDRTPFIVYMYGPVQNIMHWKVYARPVATTYIPSTDVDVQWSSSYFDPYGTYHMLGTLTNHGSDQISPSLIGGVFSPENVFLDLASVNVPIYVDAGQSVPFDINAFQVMSYIPDEKIANSKMVVLPDLYWTFPTDYNLVTLDVDDTTLLSNTYDWAVNGTVINTTDQKLSSISVIAQIQDREGQVLVINSATIFPPDGMQTIDPGTTNEFNLTLYPPENLDLTAQRLNYIVQGIIAE